MKKITTLLAVVILMTSFIGNQMIVVNAAEVDKTAYELCKSANTWEEYKEIFEDFQYERGDFLGHVLKELPEKTKDYNGQIICYTCGVAYWNPDGTLEKMEYIPFNEVAQLKDEQKPQIDKEFEGTILILLCTTDTILGWTSLDGLYQYENAMGNMEFYNPDFIRYK